MFCRSLILLSRARVTLAKSYATVIPRNYQSTTSNELHGHNESISSDDVTNTAHPAVSTITGLNEGADLSNFLYPPTYNAREKRIAACLEKLLFTNDQIRSIIAYYRERNSIYTVDPTVIRPALEYWITAVKPPRNRADVKEEVSGIARTDRVRQRPFYNVKVNSNKGQLKSGDEVEEDEDSFEYDYRKTEVRTILARNPLLLLINPTAMNRRLKLLTELGILSGKNDIWRIFHHAPIAFFLQDWSEFLSKFFYIQHRVLEWYIDKHVDPYPTPHPAVKDARIFDLPYHVIKARFEFAIKSGLKSPIMLIKGKTTPITLSLGDIFLSPMRDYLRRMAPGLNEEEYDVYERYVEEKEDPEDKMIHEMANLQANSNYDTSTMNTEVAKRIAGQMLEQSISSTKEPLEALLGVNQVQKQRLIEGDDEEEGDDPLQLLRDELLVKRAMFSKKKSKLMKERDLARLRLIFPNTKAYPTEADASIDKGPFIELKQRKAK